jgi:sialate O-acetylesterase
MNLVKYVLSLLCLLTITSVKAAIDTCVFKDAAPLMSQADGTIVAQAANATMISEMEPRKTSKAQLVPVKDRYGFEGTNAAQLETGKPAKLAWMINLEKAGEYDVLIDYSGGREAFAEVTAGDSNLRKERFGAGDRRIHNLGRMTLKPGIQPLTFAFGRMDISAETRNMSVKVNAVIISPSAIGLSRKTERELHEYLRPIIERKPVPGLILPGIFSDHMVLQRDMPVPVWGLAKAGDTVTVSFAGQAKMATADRFGRWILRLEPLNVNSKPQTFTVNTGEQTVTFTDVLVGDVWLGSGQSNMEIGVDAPPKWPRHIGAEALIGDRDFPLIRISSQCPRYFKTPNGGWVPATHENIFQTSAMMVCSMVPLQAKLEIPIGIIVRALSSSPSGAWIEPDAIAADTHIQKQIADYASGGYDQAWAAAVEKAKEKNNAPTIPYSAPAWPGLSCWRTDGAGQLWQSLLDPVAPFAIKGVVWDQGENGTDIGGTTHATVQPVLIKAWRQAWGQGDFPFVHVQKNNYDVAALAAITAVPNSYMVSNKGLEQSLHPVDKEKYGARVAELISKKVYDDK